MSDLISRQAAIDRLTEYGNGRAVFISVGEAIIRIEQLPPIQPVNCSEFPNNSDTISRQAAIDAVGAALLSWSYMPEWRDNKIIEAVEQLPPIQPKRGKWIKTARWGRVYKCNQCGNFLDFDGVNVGRGDANFCPNCGAKMEVNNESN